MYELIDNLHSWNRYILLALLIFVLIRALMGMMGKKPFTDMDNKGSLFLFISTHLQLLLGLLLYFVYSPIVQNAKMDMSASMKNPDLRYYLVEHFTGMLLATILISLGRILMKKAKTDSGKHKRLAIFTGIAVVIIVGTLAPKGLLFGVN